MDDFTESELMESGYIQQMQQEEEDDALDLGHTPSSKKKPHKYSTEEDLWILKEVIVEKPFGKTSAKAWQAVFSRCEINVKNGAALKTRFERLLDHFRKENAAALRGSGLEEDYNEKMKLLQDISDLMRDFQEQVSETANKKKTQAELDQEQAVRIREAASTTLKRAQPEDSTYEDTKKKSKQDEFLKIIQKSEDREHEVKVAQLEFEKRKLSLKERDFELRERELKLKEDGEAHKQEMDRKKLELEDKKMENERMKTEADIKEKKLLFELLSSKFHN